MNWRLLLILITLFSLLAGIYVLDGLLQHSGWAEYHDGTWEITAM